MPSKTPYTLILEALKMLGSEKFLEFCGKLTDLTQEESSITVFDSEVENPSPTKIAKLLVSRFSSDALDKTIWGLRGIGCNREADELEAQKRGRRSEAASPQRRERSRSPLRSTTDRSQSPPRRRSSRSTILQSSSKEHFVDKHRDKLIKRVSNIGPILDHLFQNKILQQEQYDEAMEKGTKQAQMRFLFKDPLRSGGKKAKDVFLSALEVLEPVLFEDLRENQS